MTQHPVTPQQASLLLLSDLDKFALEMDAAENGSLVYAQVARRLRKIVADHFADVGKMIAPGATPQEAREAERLATAKRYAEYLRLIAAQRSTISNRTLNDIADFITTLAQQSPAAQGGEDAKDLGMPQ